MGGISDNRRIAKNTVLLYIRTAVVLFISLYTSRLVLKVLGAEDLGIYNVVGGIVALMIFFRSALSKSTSRFITYELGGSGGSSALKRIFSSAMTIHIVIAIAALIIGETIGLLILEHWTDIPNVRRDAAFWVFQSASGVFCLQLIIAPYESVIIAHENMSVFAYMSIFTVLLKLGVVCLLQGSSADRLVLYGLSLFLIDLLGLIIYYQYNKKKYPVFRFCFLWDREYSRKLFSFSGWTLAGSSANAATQQGVSLLFNNFVGLIANTALGFANQVNSAVSHFVASFQTAFNPQIIKLYASKEIVQMHLLMLRASKFSFLLAYVLVLPLVANMKYVLSIWLREVPEYTVEFCQLILVCCVIDSISGVFNTAITATGNIRGFQIGISISFVLDLITAAALLMIHWSPALVFGSRIITRGFINMLIMMQFARKQLSFDIKNYVSKVLTPIMVILMVSIPLILLMVSFFHGWQSLIMSCATSILLNGCLAYLLLLEKDERASVNVYIKRIVCRLPIRL